MTPVIVTAIFVMTVALVWWNAGILRRFKNDYRYDGEFHGNRYECVVRFANSESGIWCFLGADTAALYLLSDSARKRSWWTWNYRSTAREFLGTDLRIPWSDLDWREKGIFIKDCIWFEIPAGKIYFYVSREVGDKLLVDAGRKIPVQA
jgi:hypothetical protein